MKIPMLKKTFEGGVRLKSRKELTETKQIITAPLPSRVIIPLVQGAGKPPKIHVKPGDSVLRGQKIAEQSAFISANVHASISGKVTHVRRCLNPVFGETESVTIESDGRDEESKNTAVTKEDVLSAVKEAGIIGMGGAGFPTHVKLSPPKEKPIDTIIINGAECEPYLTCDYRVMLERAEGVLGGLEVIASILKAKNIIVAVEDDKKDAARILKRSAEKIGGILRDVRIETLPSKYPQGGEKQIIKALTGREVPEGGLPMDVGCLVENVQTAFAIHEAARYGKPLIERVITITGECASEPVNVMVRIGTLISDLYGVFGGVSENPAKIIFGGPMMGISQFTADIPVMKGTSGILFLPGKSVPRETETACIRCGRCIEACAMRLIPTAIVNNVKKEFFEEAKKLGVANCCECGACAYICPAKIPLLDYLKYGKARIL